MFDHTWNEPPSRACNLPQPQWPSFVHSITPTIIISFIVNFHCNFHRAEYNLNKNKCLSLSLSGYSSRWPVWSFEGHWLTNSSYHLNACDYLNCLKYLLTLNIYKICNFLEPGGCLNLPSNVTSVNRYSLSKLSRYII